MYSVQLKGEDSVARSRGVAPSGRGSSSHNLVFTYYLFTQGTKSERASNALTTMGPAILNGGVTTVLALSLLGFSKSYAYIVFFKVDRLSSTAWLN